VRKKRELVMSTTQKPEISPGSVVNQRKLLLSEPLELPELPKYRGKCGFSPCGRLEARVRPYRFTWRNPDPFGPTLNEFKAEFNQAFQGYERSQEGSL